MKHLGGRILAEPICSELDVPNFDRSAMDGYALKAEALVHRGLLRFRLRWLEKSHQNRFEHTVDSGQAVRIMTGGPVPAGADAILVAEHAESEEPDPCPGAGSSGKHIGFMRRYPC